MKTTFNIGDLVTLKSDSPIMTVESQKKDTKILCVWFNKRGEKCSGSFFAETLKQSSDEPSIIKETTEVNDTEGASSNREIKTEQAEEQKPKKHKKHHENEEQDSVD